MMQTLMMVSSEDKYLAAAVSSRPGHFKEAMGARRMS
jgi:hypothetical protein